MDYRTMGQMEVDVEKRYEQKQIYVVQGNLDDKKLRKLPKVNGYILVTGNVDFCNNNTVPSGLIVLGDAKMCRAIVKGSMYVYGKCKAQRITVHGDLNIKPEGSEICELRLVGSLTYL